MSDTVKIFSAIAKCMEEIGAIGKNAKNQKQGYMYRGIDTVYNALQPVLIKNHVFVVPEVLDQYREERKGSSGGNLIYSILKVKYTFYAEDGSFVCATVTGEGMDSGDKASNKAMSAAFKYACFQVLCIPTEEMVDPDAETPEPSCPASKSSSKKRTPEASQDQLIRDARGLAEEFSRMRKTNVDPVLAAVWGTLGFAPFENLEDLDRQDLQTCIRLIKKWVKVAENSEESA